MRSIVNLVKALWPARIRGRLILGITFIQFLLTTTFIIYLVNHQRQFLMKQNLQQTFSLVNDYAINSTPFVMANELDELERLTLSHTNFPNLKYAMILSPEGLILAHTNTAYIGNKLADSVSLQLRRLTTGKILIENEHILDIAVPIVIDKKMAGWARIAVGQDYIQTNMTSIIRRGTLYIIIGMLLSALFAIIIARELTKGLYELVSTADSIKDGDRNVRAPVLPSFELSQLGTAFNQMLDDISKHESLLSLVVESMPVGVWIFDRDGVIISDNTAGNQIWEGAKKLGGKGPKCHKAWKLDTGELLQPTEWASARAIAKGEATINEEIEIELPNGKRKTLLNSAMPLKSKEGITIGALAINVDISEGKKITEQLALSESTFRSAFGDSAIGMALVLPDGTFQRVNKELCRMTGYTEQELLSTTFQQITLPADLEKDLRQLKRALNQEIDSFQMEKRYIHKSGSIVWAHLAVSLVRNEDGKPLFFVSQIEDIGERKLQEEIILHEKNLSDTMINFMPGIFYVSDKDANMLRWNGNLERITGYTSSEIITMKSTDLIDPRQVDFIMAKRQQAFATGSATVEVNLLTKRGAKLDYYITVVPITYNNSPCILGMGVDFTEKKMAEQTVIQFSRLFQFTSAINDMMLHAEDKQSIYEQACNIAINFGRFSLAWIGNISAEGKIEIFARAGEDKGYLEHLKSNIPGEDLKFGTFANAIVQRKPVYTNNISKEEISEAWKQEVLSRGYQSMISLPIIVGSEIQAIFTLYRSEAYFFIEEEVKLLQEVTSNIAYAIEKLQLKELRERAEAELKESEEKFRKLVEETVAGVFILQGDKYVYVNPQFEKISGYSAAELLTTVHFTHLIHGDDVHNILDSYTARRDKESWSDRYTFRGLTKDGTEVPIEMIISPISYKGSPAVIGTIIDITTKVEEEQRINRAVTNAQEMEREQISMELHDNVKQLMAASLLNVDFIKMLLKHDQATAPIIENIKSYMRDAIEELRKISHQLAPSVDNSISLEEKIRTLVNTMNVSNRINVNYHFENSGENLGPDIQLTMYRILQEQFTNVLKHSNASLVDVTVERENGNVRLLIEDNGVGFNQVVTQSGIGLENIKRRVQVHNGSYLIQTAPGKGCKLEVNIPLN